MKMILSAIVTLSAVVAFANPSAPGHGTATSAESTTTTTTTTKEAKATKGLSKEDAEKACAKEATPAAKEACVKKHTAGAKM